MGTTTKMAIPYPEATGLVKDGWEDMKDIATQVDAKSGLVLITTVNVSGVTSFSLANNTFSSNYLNYRIILNTDIVAASNELEFRLRASGTDNTSANYAWARYGVAGSSTTANLGSSQTALDTKFRGTPVSGTYPSFQILDIFSPFSTDYNTGFNSVGLYFDALASNWAPLSASGIMSVNTSYDSMTFFGATFTGTYSVYGYNK